MTTLRTTVIMKTDIRGSTVRFRALPEVDLDGLLSEHRAFVSRVAAAHDGHTVKPDGDGFWMVFPSITAGALAAITMQEELGHARVGKSDDRLAMCVRRFIFPARQISQNHRNQHFGPALESPEAIL